VGGDAAAAASVIHTDIGKNLVKAEVVSFDTLIEDGGWAEAKAAGHLRTEAKDYLMHDGDVCHFLHSGGR
jgi:ribosome-binding ATPase YchF (GTP1/OBG family)